MSYTKTNVELLNDLSIKNEIIPSINKCITIYGSNALFDYSEKIVFDINILNKRLLLLEHIRNNGKERTFIKEKLNSIKEMQETINEWLFENNYTDLYFKRNIFNYGSLLTISNKMKFLTVIIYPLIYIVIYSVLKYFGIHYDFYSYIKSLYYGYQSTISVVITLIISKPNAIYYISHSLSILYCLYQIYSLYNTFNNGFIRYNKCNNMEQSFDKIKKVIHVIENISKTNLFDKLSKIKYYNDNENIKDLITDLKEKFDNKNLGNKLLLYQNKDYKDDFEIILKIIGHLDAQICLSELLNQGYSPPQFENYDKPFFIVNDVFHPLLSQEQEVNSGTLSDPNLMIITGPNKSGKSTFMKSLTLSIYMSQVFCISCSKSIVLTPFIDIYTYLNIPDNIGRESLFEAEINRCFNFYKKAKNLKKNEYIFCIIDELFTGTNPPEGISSSYAICKKLTECNNALICASTHFYEICKISNVVYKKFVAEKNHHKYHFNYKIYDGISNQYIAIELLKEKGYDDDVINTALNKLNEISLISSI